MAYTLSNTCAKNLCKRTVLIQLDHQKRGHVFLEHSVPLYPSSVVLSLIIIMIVCYSFAHFFGSLLDR